MNKIKTMISATLYATTLIVASGSAMAEAGKPDKVTNWTFQPCFDQSDAGWAGGVVPWVKAVEEATEGTVKIKLEPSGAITSGSESFGGTAAGLLDGTACWGSVYSGDMPEGMLAFGLAMGAGSTEQAWDVHFGDPKYRIGDLIQEAAKERNLRWVGWTNQGPNAMFTKTPVRKMEDLKGMKMRAGGPQAIFHTAMGGAPVAMGGGEIYTAIKLGTIDGTYWDTGGIDDMSFQEVIKYAAQPGWAPAQHQEIFLNLGKYNELTDWQREKIDGIFKSTYFETSKMHADGVSHALQVLKDSGGEVINFSPEEVKRMRDKSIADVWPKVAERSKRNAKAIEIMKQYLKDKGEL